MSDLEQPAPDEVMLTRSDTGTEDAFGAWRHQREHDPDAAFPSFIPQSSVFSSIAKLSQSADELAAANELGKAEKLVKEALELAPQNGWLLVQLGRIIDCQGRSVEALPILKQGLGQVDCAPLQKRAETIEQQQAQKQANIESTKNGISKADMLIENGDLTAADAMLSELEKTGLFSFVIKIKRANIALNTGRLEDSKNLIDEADRFSPNNKWTSYNRAMIEEIEGETATALAEIQRALSCDPENRPFKNMYARLQKRAALEAIEPGVYDRIQRRSQGEDKDPIKILCWDLSHNPAGRAMALADVAQEFGTPEIVGPILTADTTTIWKPLADDPTAATTSSWLANEPAHFVAGAVRYVMENPCERVWVSKARFPSLFMGCLYKLVHGATMVVDLDDDELAFVDATDAIGVSEFLEEDSAVDWSNFASPLWGQLAVGMTQWADAITTCNEVLQNIHGGEIVHHARDNKVFDPDSFDRKKSRERLGFSDQDKVVLFMGTPRRHKGVLEIARAVIGQNDPDVALLVVGTFTETQLEKQLKSLPGLRLVHLEDQPLSVAAEINFAADLSVAFQDTGSRIALSQTPAKLTDAAAMGRLSLTSDLPTVTPFVEHGAAIVPLPNETLTKTLERGLSEATDPSVSKKIRAFFETQLSTSANAVAAVRAFESAQINQKDLPADFQDLLDRIARRIPVWNIDQLRAFFEEYTEITRPQAKVTSLDKDLDVVFFWKQNDTGIYGRRQDWVHRTLAELPNVRKILHIDTPICADRLNNFPEFTALNGEDRMVAKNTISRFLNVEDCTDIHYRSFVYSGRTTSLLGRQLDAQSMFPARVAQWMEELGMGENTLAWVCPVVPDFDKVQNLIGFQDVVADVIDNQNLWPMRPETRRKIVKSYKHIFENCQVAFANCEPVAEWLRSSGLDPRVIPNGLALPTKERAPKAPSLVKGLKGPIIGYVGNMSDRIDWELLNDLAELQPDWNFKMIGKLPRVQTDAFKSLRARMNVLMPGVVPADQMPAWYNAMNVGLIPHINTQLSQAMNPLKLYVYRAHGLRVVSTPIQNIGDFGDDVIIAEGARATSDALSRAIEDSVQNGPHFPDDETLKRLSWPVRVNEMMDSIQHFHTQKQSEQK